MLQRDKAINAIKNISSFSSDLEDLFSKWDLQESWSADSGRRNSFLSLSQEKEIARVLDAKHSGETGKADIIHKGSEIECKITSPSTKSGKVVLWTDYVALQKKEKLSYIYLIHKNMKEVCVLFFEDLTIDNFTKPSKSSKNKSSLKTYESLDKCKMVIGGVKLKNGNKSVTFEYENIDSLKDESTFFKTVEKK